MYFYMLHSQSVLLVTAGGNDIEKLVTTEFGVYHEIDIRKLATTSSYCAVLSIGFWTHRH